MGMADKRSVRSIVAASVQKRLKSACGTAKVID
jgi:hypothetical protein